jgi:hypothetical protein
MNAQLLLYAFDPGSSFGGEIVGGLERAESGGSLVILDALFIHSDAESGELSVASVQGDGAGSIVSPLLLFRLDAAERRRITARALADRSHGIPADTVRQIGAALSPGAAIAAILVDHRWLSALDDGLARTGGRKVSSDFVEVAGLTEVVPDLMAAAGRTGT